MALQLLAAEALPVLVDASLETLNESVGVGEQGLSESGRKLRGDCVSLLNSLPVTCRGLHTRARQDPRFAALMFYERTRLGAAGSGHFLEGLCPGLPLFLGATPQVLPDENIERLRLRDVLADRMSTIGCLEKLENGTNRMMDLESNNYLSDLPGGLPARVHVFFARMRAVCQGLSRVKPETSFVQCANHECCRRFYIGGPLETSQAGIMRDEAPDDYWSLVAGTPPVRCAPREFCSCACAQQWLWQRDSAFPAIDDSEARCRKDGRARVGEAFRLAMRRNEVIGRHLRGIEKEKRRFPALGAESFKKQRDRFVRQLNVDVGLLHAGAVLAESRVASTNKVLPGAVQGWRSRPFFYARAIKEASKIYDVKHKSKTVVCNTLIQEPFLERLRERASHVI